MNLLSDKDIENAFAELKTDPEKSGISTGWKSLDEFWRVEKGQLNIVTGIPSHGKSEFMDALMVNLYEKWRWRHIIFSPENYPAKTHIRKISEKLMGKRFHFDPNEYDYNEAMKSIKSNFLMINTGDEGTNLGPILKLTQETKGVDLLVIDPWNELEETGNARNETDFIGKTLRYARRWARFYKIALFIVAHPHMLRTDKGVTPVPTAYNISGSAHWFNKADNIICVYREGIETQIHIQKVKFSYVGKPGIIKLRFDVRSGRYDEWTDADENESRQRTMIQNQQDFTSTLARTGERL